MVNNEMCFLGVTATSLPKLRGTESWLCQHGQASPNQQENY